MLILTNNIRYFSSDTTLLYIHKNVSTGLLVSVSQNHLSGPPVLRTLLVYSCYKLKLLLKYMCAFTFDVVMPVWDPIYNSLCSHYML